MPALRIGPTWRMLSPAGASTLTTSAPSPARSWVANGPITTLVRSMIFTPASGPLISIEFRLDRHRRLHRIRDEAFVVRLLVQPAHLVLRRLFAAERDARLERHARDRNLALGIALQHAGCLVDVAIDDELGGARKMQKP